MELVELGAGPVGLFVFEEVLKGKEGVLVVVGFEGANGGGFPDGGLGVVG